MSYADFLYQTCTISRPMDSGEGRYNQHELELVQVATDVPCRMVEKSVRVLDEKTNEYAWVQATLLLFLAGVDVQAKDEISIDDQDGTWVAIQRLDRRSVNSIHHISMMVEAYNG